MIHMPKAIADHLASNYRQQVESIHSSGIRGFENLGRRSVAAQPMSLMKVYTYDIYTILDRGFITEVREKPHKVGTEIFLAIDPNRFITSDDLHARADLVRSLFVADTHDIKGRLAYQQRYAQTHTPAINLQIDWMNHSNNSEGVKSMDNDPRKLGIEEMLLRVLGEERYYADMGFEDFERAMKTIKQSSGIGSQPLSKTQERKLSFLKGKSRLDLIAQFIEFRRVEINDVYESLKQNSEGEYINWSRDMRAERSAEILLRSVLGPTSAA